MHHRPFARDVLHIADAATLASGSERDVRLHTTAAASNGSLSASVTQVGAWNDTLVRTGTLVGRRCSGLNGRNCSGHSVTARHR
jgi:hypothetical protein